MAKRWLLAIVTGVMATVLAMIVVLASHTGTRWLLQRVLIPMTHGQLTVAASHGSLLGGLQLHQVVWHTASVNLSLDQVELQWRPWQLWRWRLSIDDLSADSVRLDLLPSLEPTASTPGFQPKPLQWPWYWPALNIKRLHIGSLSVHRVKDQRFNWQSLDSQVFIDHAGLAWFNQLTHLAWGSEPAANIDWQVYGSWSHYATDIRLQVLGEKPQTWHVAGSGDRHHLSFDQVGGSLWPEKAQWRTRLTWWPRVSLQSRVQASEFDFRRWWPDWPSHLQIDIEAALSVDAATGQLSQASLFIHRWQGLCRHLPMQANGEIHWQPRHLLVDRLQLRSGSAALEAKGVIAPDATDIGWQVAIPAIGDLLPNASGSMTAQGTVKADDQHALDLRLQTKVDDVRYQAWRLAKLTAQVVFHAARPGEFTVDVEGRDWRWAEHRLERLAIVSRGDYRQHRLRADMVADKWSLAAELAGGFGDKRWRGQWQRLAIHAPNGVWSLKAPTPLSLSQTEMAMAKPLCLQQGREWVCGQANWQKEGQWRLLASTSRLHLAPWQWLLPDPWHWTGSIQSQLDLAGQPGQLPQGQASIKAEGLSFGYQPRKTAMDFSLGTLSLTADLQPSLAALVLSIDGALGRWQSRLELPDWQQLSQDWQQQAIRGSLAGRLAPLSRLATFVPQLRDASGVLQAYASVAGRLGQPKIDLDTRVTNARVSLPDYNIVLTPINLHVTGDPFTRLTLNGWVQSGPGRLRLSGMAEQLLVNPKLQVACQGQNFLASHLVSYEIYASPDLRLTYQDRQWHLAGSLSIPDAKLHFVDYQKSVVSLSSDVVFVDGDSHSTPFFSDVRVNLGPKVSLQFGGLTGRLTGQLALHDEPNRPTSGLGQMNLVDATYRGFGQEFVISKGLAQFRGGDVTNPDVNVQATRTLTNVVPVAETGQVVQSSPMAGFNNGLVVGVEMKGPLKTSGIHLFSTPPGLSQADILSYMLLGRPTSEATGSGAQMLMNAASMLNNGGGPISQLQQQLKNTLGLEVDVGATSQYSKETQTVTQNTSVILGKALSPRLFLNYSIGIAQPVNVLRLTYKISSRWSAQTESSSLGNGGDIFYTINRK